MKKMILGLTMTVTGFICSTLIIAAVVLSPLNPWDYNGFSGWYGCLLGMQLQLPLIVFAVLAVSGLILCIIEAFRKE